MYCRSFAATDIGRRRQINEDSFLRSDELGLFVVADGMGGHAAGEVASQESIDAIHSMVSGGVDVIVRFNEHPEGIDEARNLTRLLESAIQSAAFLVFGIAQQSPARQGMGTTISALLIAEGFGVTAQVGDSRVYCVREGDVVQMTDDHTLVNWQVKQGLLTLAEARQITDHNVITRAVGSHEYVQVDTQIFPVKPGDCFLLCSDGLHGYLKHPEIPKIMELGLERSARRFVAMANERGGKDNITALVVEVEGYGRLPTDPGLRHVLPSARAGKQA
ncbi:MAG: serine/threonine-protein phosphatase [Deltaproteobacteria bacterium]|nr:serine/threonine-protein phosphatase [Deltaproteobacteria bacterium]